MHTIVHVSIYPPQQDKYSNKQSGVAFYEQNLLEALAKEGYRNIVLCEKLNNKFENYMQNDVQVIRCFDLNIGFIFQLSTWVKKLKPTIVHIQQEKSLYGNIVTAWFLQWFLLYLRLKGIKVVTTIHGLVEYQTITQDFLNQNGAKNMPAWLGKIGFWAIFQPLIWWSHKVIVHNNKLAAIARKDYGGKNKVYVIPIGIESFEQMNQLTAKKRLGIAKNTNVILFLGYANGYKGIDLLIESYAKYYKSNPNTKLIICSGPSPNLEHDEQYMKYTYHRLRNKASSMLQHKSYIWPFGTIPSADFIVYYSATDVCVFPYLQLIASSGPMSICIGYNKPYLVSKPLSEFALFPKYVFDTNTDSLSKSLQVFFSSDKKITQKKVQKLKEKLLWSSIVKSSYNKLYNNL